MSEFGGESKRNQVIAIASVVVIAVAMASWVLWLRPHGVNAPKGRYFANEETGELILEPLDAVPPLNDANGKPIIVRATVYSLDGGKTRQVAYYEKYTDEAKQARASPDQNETTQRLIDHGLLVRLPADGSPWVIENSSAGQKVTAALPTGDNVTPCSIVLP